MFVIKRFQNPSRKIYSAICSSKYIDYSQIFLIFYINSLIMLGFLQRKFVNFISFSLYIFYNLVNG